MTKPPEVAAGDVLGLDPGTVRIGVAHRAGPDSMMAMALPAIANDEHALERIVDLVRELAPTVIVIGLPLRLDGTLGPAAKAAVGFARSVADLAQAPVRMVDERLTTVQAQRRLHAAGRDVRQSRPAIDSASAIIIVEAFLAGACGSDPADVN